MKLATSLGLGVLCRVTKNELCIISGGKRIIPVHIKED